MNPDMWLNGHLEPALDLWTQTNGASLYRLTIECTDWVCPGCTLAQANAQIALLHNLDSATLVSTYETPKMQDLWNTIAYMNSKGISGSQISVEYPGLDRHLDGRQRRVRFPQLHHLGIGTAIRYHVGLAGILRSQGQGVELYHNRPSERRRIQYGIEGPVVGTGQFATIFADLVSELAYMGLTDMTLTGPSTNGSGTITLVRRRYGGQQYGSGQRQASLFPLLYRFSSFSPQQFVQRRGLLGRGDQPKYPRR